MSALGNRRREKRSIDIYSHIEKQETENQKNPGFHGKVPDQVHCQFYSKFAFKFSRRPSRPLLFEKQ